MGIYTLEDERGTYSHHPFRKENDLTNLHDYGPAVSLQGCTKHLPTGQSLQVCKPFSNYFALRIGPIIILLIFQVPKSSLQMTCNRNTFFFLNKCIIIVQIPFRIFGQDEHFQTKPPSGLNCKYIFGLLGCNMSQLL